MSLMPRLVLGDLDLTSYPFGIEWGRDYGSPQNVVETLISSLPAGDVLSVTRVENREITLTVFVEGVTLDELAENEARLVAECDKDRNTLLAHPGDIASVASVFETFRAQVEMVFDDDGEMALLRRYELTIPALPHVRDEFLTVSPALPIEDSVVPGITTTRQLLRSVQVGGSVNTQGTIEVSHPTTGLGEVVVYTYNSDGDYQPALSPFTADASDEYFADPSAIAGGYWNLATTYRWVLPVTSLPSGEAIMVFRAHNTEPGDCVFDWTAFSEMDGGGLGDVLGQQSGSFTHNFPVANVPHMIVVDVPLNLPTVPLGPAGRIALDLRRLSAAGPGATYMHEAWLFSTKGSLSIAGAGPRKRFVVRAPSLDDPQGSMWVGDSEDGSDWYSVSALSTSRQHHILRPGENRVFTVTMGAEDAEVSVEHYNRHHTHAIGKP